MRAMICRIVQRAFIDGGWCCRKEKLNFATVQQTASVDYTLNEPVLSAKAY